jgi:hypothetical protein
VGKEAETGDTCRLKGLAFGSGQSARRIPFEFVGNHIYLSASVIQ